ncbi:Hypothetical predicted protein [Mytilus galloprovincialis]|uniref:Uncharacterized protein n=1 Tax=Mytilus galloprovincialis TaxID=29158 RepID=A0A8B6F4P3_MYTGA|nr:Hypothetical predicted protein [Mytilus galloprovincialis]
MKITLFCVLVFWTICSTTSREIPQQYSRNARIAKELNELEHLLKEREYETHNPSDVEEERETTLQETEEEEERELENIDPDDPESNLLEGMEIENNGHPHLVQGLHPENSAKTYGDSHDSHKLIPEQEALAKKSVSRYHIYG